MLTLIHINFPHWSHSYCILYWYAFTFSDILAAGGAGSELRKLLRKFMNATEKPVLMETLRALWMVEMQEGDMALVDKAVQDKVKASRSIPGDVGVRANLLYKRWAVANEVDLDEESINEESFRPMRELSPIDRVECTQCGKSYSNQANYVRHERAVHAKRTRVEEDQQPPRSRRTRLGN